jgi:hypothetical protein
VRAFIRLACLFVLLAETAAVAQVSPASRARKFWEIFSKADASGKALAFDVLSPADDPVIFKTCFKALQNGHPLVMSAAVSFLTGTRDEEALAYWIEKGLGHRTDLVRLACVYALADDRGQPRPHEKLLPALDDGAWFVRCAAMEGLGRHRFRQAYDGIAGRIGDADWRVRVTLLEALRRINDLKYTQQVIQGLKDPCWQVRSAAIEAVRKMRPRAAFGFLIDRLEDESGRLRVEAHRALVSVTGRDFGEKVEPWRDWWTARKKKRGEQGRVDVEPSDYVIKPRKSIPRKCFRVPTELTRFVFVLDISDSMSRFAKPLRPMEGVGPDETTSRYAILKTELAAAMRTFRDTDFFNVILFGTKVHAWKPGLVQATPKARKDAVGFLNSRAPHGETNLFDALALAFGVSKRALETGRGYFDEIGGGKRPDRSDEGPETIFLLSDGVPNRGAITEPDKIVKEISRANRVRRIVIHTIAVGRFHADFLRRLAKENYGEAVTVGEGGVR